MKAAERAFADDQKFMSQTFVAIEPTGMDPCELRLKSGDTAVLDLVARRIPLVEFVLRTTVGRFDLDTAEGRIAALDRGVPLVARIKDHALRDEYARRLAGLVGFGRSDAGRAAGARAVRRSDDRGNAASRRRPRRRRRGRERWTTTRRGRRARGAQGRAAAAGDRRPAVRRARRGGVPAPAHRRCARRSRRRVARPPRSSGPGLDAAVEQQLPDERCVSGMHALAVEPLHAGADAQDRYAERRARTTCTRSSPRARSPRSSRKLQRINPLDEPEEHARLFGELISLEAHRRVLRERAIGGQ